MCLFRFDDRKSPNIKFIVCSKIEGEVQGIFVILILTDTTAMLCPIALSLE